MHEKLENAGDSQIILLDFCTTLICESVAFEVNQKEALSERMKFLPGAVIPEL